MERNMVFLLAKDDNSIQFLFPGGWLEVEVEGQISFDYVKNLFNMQDEEKLNNFKKAM